MKHAKKLLAVVMVLSMVAAFSAIAFAANPSISCSVGEYKDGKATVTICLTDCVGLTSGNLSFGYDAGKVTKVVDVDGADKELAGKCGNAFTSEINKTSNPIEYGFYFKNDLYSAEDWAAAAEDYEVSGTVNATNFECVKLKFTAEEGTVITVAGELKKGTTVIGTVSTSFTLGEAKKDDETTTVKKDDETTTVKKDDETTTVKKDDETTTAKPVEEKTTAKPADTSAKYDKFGNKILGYDRNGQAIIGYVNGQPVYSQDTSAHKNPSSATLDIEPNNNGKAFVDGNKAAADDKCTTAKVCKTAANVKTDGGKKTGDNSVLAIVAGVIAMAGAAYVVTKKRK